MEHNEIFKVKNLVQEIFSEELVKKYGSAYLRIMWIRILNILLHHYDRRGRNAAEIEKLLQSYNLPDQIQSIQEIRQKIDAATEQQVQLKIEETMASDEVQQKIMAATEQASAGAVQIRSLKQQLDQYNVFYMGLNSYTAGVDQAAAGAQRLQSNMPALLDGVKQLRDGAMQLSDGLKQFNEEGVEKLVSVLGDDVEGLAERLTATVEVSRNYRSFSGLTDGMDGAVRFIYRTEAVEKAE